MARRTSSSNGASGMRRLPFTPPLFLIAVRMSPSVSSLRPAQERAVSHQTSMSCAPLRRQLTSLRRTYILDNLLTNARAGPVGGGHPSNLSQKNVAGTITSSTGYLEPSTKHCVVFFSSWQAHLEGLSSSRPFT